MKIKTKQERGAFVVEIHGNMVGGPENSERFHTTVKDALEEGHRWFIIDLSDCAYVPSPGVGMIMRAHASIRSRDGSLQLVVDNERVRNLFNLIQLYQVLNVHDTLEEAITAQEASAEA